MLYTITYTMMYTITMVYHDVLVLAMMGVNDTIINPPSTSTGAGTCLCSLRLFPLPGSLPRYCLIWRQDLQAFIASLRHRSADYCGRADTIEARWRK